MTVAENTGEPRAYSIGHVIVGNQASGKALSHWNQMLSSLRKPIAMWHPLRKWSSPPQDGGGVTSDNTVSSRSSTSKVMVHGLDFRGLNPGRDVWIIILITASTTDLGFSQLYVQWIWPHSHRVKTAAEWSFRLLLWRKKFADLGNKISYTPLGNVLPYLGKKNVFLAFFLLIPQGLSFMSRC